MTYGQLARATQVSRTTLGARGPYLDKGAVAEEHVLPGKEA